MSHKRPTQAQRILKYIEDFGSITQAQAIEELGVMRLASRISELRKRGHEIESEWVPVVNRWGEPCKIKRYKLKKTDAPPPRRLERAIQSEIIKKEA